MYLKTLLLLVSLNIYLIKAQRGFARFRRYPIANVTIALRDRVTTRVTNRLMNYRQRNTARICYDTVGCFEVPHSRSPLQKAPESPTILDTKWFLFRKDIPFTEPNILFYDDNGTSLNESKFNYSEPLKMYIHGYMSKWNDRGALVAADAYSKLGDYNYLIMDWTKGARGPQYTTAAANSELVGRQLGILLLNMIQRGLDPKKIHLIGFSLGAHVAGCAAELLKMNGIMISRITGLDAAGPLFRHNYLKEKTKKLDKMDADLVDVLHTDSSPVFVDGFGIWEPIGHVDFYANGGQEQPGCIDQQASIVVSTFDRTLSRDSACSHIRAYHLYLETLLNKVSGHTCEFIGFKCPGGQPQFEKGQCFPQIGDKTRNPLALDIKYQTELGKLGEDVNGNGVMYFVTRDKSPFCGTQLQATVGISQKTLPTRGVIQLQLRHGNYTTNFRIKCDATDLIMKGSHMSGLAAAEYDSLNPTETIIATLTYFNFEYQDQNNNTVPIGRTLYIDKVSVNDMFGHSWQYCQKSTLVGDPDQQFNSIILKLKTNKNC